MKNVCTWLLLIVVLGLAGWRICSNLNSPFNNPKKTFNKVAEYMAIKINPALLPPQVLKGSEVTNEYNNSVWGWDVGNKRSPIFDYRNNAIILPDNAEIHNLAHEYVHYFQFTYKGCSFEQGMSDTVELEAVAIQNLFR